MTPINLMFALKQRVEEAIADYKFLESDPNDNGERKHRIPKIYLQHLPEKLEHGAVDPADYPFVQIVLGGGMITDGVAAQRTGEDSNCQIAIMAGGYDDGIPVDADDPNSTHDRQGWLIPTEILYRIAINLTQKPIIGGKYKMILPIDWELPNEQPAPLWYGLMNLSFTLPIPREEFGMERWTMNQTLSPKQPYVEKIFT
jgi:hypothetical protein